MVNPTNVDAIASDRKTIVDNFISESGDVSLGRITVFAGQVFYEPGWDWDVVEIIGRLQPYEFMVKSFDPEAR